MKVTKYALVIGSGLLCLMLPGALRGDTVYTYVGNFLTTCVGTSVCTGSTPQFLSIKFDTTRTGLALDNLPLTNITADVASFSITGGIAPLLTKVNSSNYAFFIETNSTGNISSWAISVNGLLTGAFHTPFDGASSCNSQNTTLAACTTLNATTPFVGDRSFTNSGQISESNLDRPGTWFQTVSTATPEPSSLLLLGTSLLGIVGALRRKSLGSS